MLTLALVVSEEGHCADCSPGDPGHLAYHVERRHLNLRDVYILPPPPPDKYPKVSYAEWEESGNIKHIGVGEVTELERGASSLGVA